MALPGPQMAQLRLLVPRVMAYQPVAGNAPLIRLRQILGQVLQDHVAAPNTPVADVVAHLQNIFPPGELFGGAAAQMPNRIQGFIRDYLNILGRPYQMNPLNRRIIFGLPAQLYDNNDDVEEAMRMLDPEQAEEEDEPAAADDGAGPVDAPVAAAVPAAVAGLVAAPVPAAAVPDQAAGPVNAEAERDDEVMIAPHPQAPPPRVAARRQPRAIQLGGGIPRLPQVLGEDDEDDAQVMEAIRRELARQRRNGAHPLGAAVIDGDEVDRVIRQKEMHQEAHRTQQSIWNAFKDDKNKFGGDIEENLSSKLRDYNKVCDNNIHHPEHDGELRLRYLYLILTGEAKEFYYSNVDGNVADYYEAVERLERQYLSDTVKDRCHTELEKLELGDVMKEHSLSVPKALAYIRDRIVVLNNLGPDDRKSESLRREYMQNSVKGHSWATHTLSRAKKDRWSLNELYQQLDADFQLHKEVYQKKSALRGKAVHPRVYYNGQGTYGKPRQPGSKSSVPVNQHRTGSAGYTARWTRARQGVAKSEFAGKCFNCQEPGHVMRNCKNPRKGVLKNISTALHNKTPMSQVLFELAVQAEEGIQEDSDKANAEQQEETESEQSADGEDFQQMYESYTDEGAGPPRVHWSDEEPVPAGYPLDSAAVDAAFASVPDFNEDSDDDMGF